MKLLLCHNYYQQPGGEDRVFADEGRLLESHGHDVLGFTMDNHTIARLARWDVARRCLWNGEVYRRIRKLIRRERPDVMHCTNIFPLISPACYFAARAEHVPVVQTLHNYRLLCPNALHFDNARICEDCVGKAIPWPGGMRRCYRRNFAASAVVVSMLTLHRLMRTWSRLVNLYIAPTEFVRAKFCAAGFPAEKILVKPNFVHPDPGPGNGDGGYSVFVGRLSAEKGIATLLDAWATLGRIPLKIVGSGPLSADVRAAASEDGGITWLGTRPIDDTLSILGGAKLLIFPSVCYETFGRTIVEAFARGTPVLASRLGAMAELVKEGRTGVLFNPGDAKDLSCKVQKLFSENHLLAGMRRDARQEYEAKYTAEHNYDLLMTIYQHAIEHSVRRYPRRHV